jgi:integrase
MSKRKKLTDLMVERLSAAPKGTRLEFRDEVLTGLWLRITDTGVKSWSIMYELGGRSRRHTLGIFPRLNVKAARDAAKSAFRQIADGIDPGEQKRLARDDKPATPNSLAVAVERWLSEGVGPRKRPWRTRTAAEWRREMEHDVLPKLGHRSLASITKRDIEGLVDEIATRAPVQANRVHTRLSRFFTWATKRGFVDVSPVVGTEKPTHEAPRDRVLSPRELAAFWRAGDKLDWPFGPLFKLLVLTAQRRETVRTMQWSEIDFERHRWEIPAAKMKMGKSHLVHLSDAAIEILQSLPKVDGCDFVFTTNGKTACSGFSRATANLCQLMAKELGEIEPFTLHDMRRSYASLSVEELKVRHDVVDKVLSHTSGVVHGVAAIYNRAELLDERAAALEAWASYVRNLVEPDKADRNVISFAARG